MHEDIVYDAEGRARFIMNVVRAAELARDDFLPRWRESWANYLVLPNHEQDRYGRTDNPLARNLGIGQSTGQRFGRAVLKDPESHQIVESLLAETMTQLFPDDGFVRARPTGGEDVELAEGANVIIEQTLGSPRHKRITYQWVKDAFITGTGVIFGDWEFEMDFEIVRTISEVSGFTISDFTRALTVIKDNVRLDNVDLSDFYPVPGADNFDDLKGAVRRVELDGRELIRQAEDADEADGWDLPVLQDAVEAGFSGSSEESPEDFKWYMNEDIDDEPMADFKPLIGFEYWGEAPWAGDDEDPIEDGSRRRRVLIINGMEVRHQDWPLKRARLPFFDITINPMTGRLYGLSPLEVIRFDQDFADVLKQMLAVAVVKSVNPPHIANVHQGVNMAKLKAFRGDVPITVEGDVRTAIAQVPYLPPIQQAQDVYQNMITPQMQKGAGAKGVVQGDSLGSKRFSASEAQTQSRGQFARPNMIAQLIEGSSLPPLGAFIMDQNALNVETNESLRVMYGEDFPTTLQAMQSKFDIRFLGARREHDKLSKAAAMERFLSVVAQVPEIRAQVPWKEFIKLYTKAIDLPELVALIGRSDVLKENVGLQKVLAEFQDGGRQGVSDPAGAASNAELEGGTIQ